VNKIPCKPRENFTSLIADGKDFEKDKAQGNSETNGQIALWEVF